MYGYSNEYNLLFWGLNQVTENKKKKKIQKGSKEKRNIFRLATIHFKTIGGQVERKKKQKTPRNSLNFLIFLKGFLSIIQFLWVQLLNVGYYFKYMYMKVKCYFSFNITFI